MSNFSEERIYERQERVRGSALIVGVGAVGGPLAEELAHLGLSPIILVDPDIFKPENLVRHNLSAEAVGQPKAIGLAEQIRRSFPLCDAKWIDRDFLELSDELQRSLVADADIVVAATGNLECDLQINRLCVQARKPAIYPGIWVDRGVRDAEIGEIIWVDPLEPTPCYQCYSIWRRGDAEAHGWHGARTDIKMVVLVAAKVVAGLLQPGSASDQMLDPERTCIWIHTYMPMSEGVSDVFEGIPGIRTRNLRVPWPPTRCPVCRGRARQRRPEPPPPPPPPEPAPQPPNLQLGPTQIRALVSAALFAITSFVLVVILVGEQRAEAGNPSNGLAGNSSPYALYGFIIGIVGFTIAIAIVEYWVRNPDHQLDWRVVGGSTLVIALILGVLITIFAKHQSASGALTFQQDPASSTQLASVKLRCDPNIGGSFCQPGGNGDLLALDILGVPNIYDLCNSGYSIHFTDNHGDNLENFSGTTCLIDLLENGAGIPYVGFPSPTSSSTGNTLCGRWIIKLVLKDPSGSVFRSARYRTTVSC